MKNYEFILITERGGAELAPPLSVIKTYKSSTADYIYAYNARIVAFVCYQGLFFCPG